MDEIITPDEHSAEIAALNHEIYELSRQLAECRESSLRQTLADPEDPFENPTDYRGFNSDYSEIQPLIKQPGYRLPLEPDRHERKKLKRLFSIGGFCLVLWFVFNLGLSLLLNNLVGELLTALNPDVNAQVLNGYARGTSILASITVVILPFCNIFTSLVGMKMARIDVNSLFKTRDFSIGKAVQYCLIGIFIWLISMYSYAIVGDVLAQYGRSGYVDTSDIGTTPLGFVVFLIYQCIIAPVTEELLMRGMLLRVFSRANQRFAVFATAMFFGLIHGNAAQFILGFLMGIFLAHITLRHGSVIPAVITHIFVNCFSLLYSYLNGGSLTTQYIAMMTVFVLAVLGMAMLFALRGSSRLPLVTPHQSRRGWTLAFSSIPFVGAFFMYLAYNFINLFSSAA